MTDVRIGARLPEYMLSNVSAELGFRNDAGKSQVIRYCLYMLAGKTPGEARALASPPRKNATMETGSTPTQAMVPEELLQEVRVKVPADKGEGYLIRYAMAHALGYTAQQCHEFAHRSPGRPRKDVAA